MYTNIYVYVYYSIERVTFHGWITGCTIMQWDLLSNQRHVRELVYVSNGENPKNRVSIMQVNVGVSIISFSFLITISSMN